MKTAAIKILFYPLFWVLFLFAIRLENYPTTARHQDYNWRSTFTGMVSRNMVEICANPFYPHVSQTKKPRASKLAHGFDMCNWF